MSDAPAAEPRRRIYYVHTRAARRHGRSCHDHRVFDARHQLMARGYLHRTFQPSPVAFGGDPDQPDVIVELRKSFPLTGKVDLRDAHTGALLGVATRGRQLYGAEGERLAQFEDAGPRRPVGRALAEFAPNALRRLAPSRLREALLATPPSGWAFALNEGASTLDERTLLCFVLTTIEIDNWKST